MKKSFVIVAFILVCASSMKGAKADETGPEKIHRFSGHFIDNGKKYPVCLSVFEHFVIPRGIVGKFQERCRIYFLSGLIS